MAGQNRSTAVMQRRKSGPEALDYFPTPPFATRALCEYLADELGSLDRLSAWEPACGELHMVRPLREYFASVRASDVHRYCDDHDLIDFTLTGATEPPVDFVITNPPFTLAQEFIETGLRVARIGVAMLVRSAFLESESRLDELFSITPPSLVLQFAERVVMLEGRLVRKGDIDPRSDKPASSATAYCWLVWLNVDRDGRPGWDSDTRLRWLPPSFSRLERIGDYPVSAPEILPPPSDGLFGAAA